MRRRTPSRGRRGFRVILLVLILVAGWIAWATRDTHPIRSFVPSGLSYHVAVFDIFEHQAALAETPMWQALSDPMNLPIDVRALSRTTHMPEWVLRNLLGDVCHVSGEDLDAFSDMVVISRMSRIGRLVEILQAAIPNIATDYAGGLRLREIPDASLYYAVRGRLLIASRSRNALIRRLVLHEDEMIDKAQLDNLVEEPQGGELIRGAIALDAHDRFGDAVKWAGFAGHVDADAAHLKWRVVLTESYRNQFAALLENAAPAELVLPPEGLVEISGHFGKPVSAVAQTLTAILTPVLGLNGEETRDPAEGDAAAIGIPDDLDGFLRTLGPGFRLVWCGIDVNEMVPVPEIAGYFDAQPGLLDGLLDLIPPPSPDAKPWDPVLRYDPETRRARLPLIGGPSIEPTFAVHGNALLASSSAVLADRLLRAAPPAQVVPKPANLFVRIRPAPCCAEIVAAGRLLAEQHFLKGYSRESFEEAAAAWQAKAALVHEVTGTFSVEKDAITGELVLSFAHASPSGPGEGRRL